MKSWSHLSGMAPTTGDEASPSFGALPALSSSLHPSERAPLGWSWNSSVGVVNVEAAADGGRRDGFPSCPLFLTRANFDVLFRLRLRSREGLGGGAHRGSAAGGDAASARALATRRRCTREMHPPQAAAPASGGLKGGPRKGFAVVTI